MNCINLKTACNRIVRPKRGVFLGILSFVFSIASLQAQTVSQLQNNYTGTTTWQNGVLTFTSSGSIQFNQNGWDIPTNVNKVVINSNVQVTGRFDCTHNVTIEGKDKYTSVLFGTNEREYAKNNGGGDDLSAVRATSGNITLKNFTCLNSKGFGFTHRGGGFMTIDNCRIIDNRGGAKNNSDGIVTWGGGLVKDCYIETGDDNIKVYGDITVENTECHMVLNSVPVQLGWGNYGSGATGIFRNFKVTGTNGRNPSGKPIICARDGNYNKTLIFEGLDINNPNASLFSFRFSSGHFDITMSDAKINVGSFVYEWNNNVTANIEICGTNYNKNTTKTSWDCTSGNSSPTANAGADQTVADADANGSEIVTLDGSGSTDSDGTISSYVWTEGGSQIATGATPNVSLPVGVHTITLIVTDNDGATDTDNITVTVTAGGCTGLLIAGKIEAEDYSAQSGVQTENASDAGGGLNVGWINNGDWTEYEVCVEQSGTYNVDLRVASAQNGGIINILANGTQVGSVAVNVTGGWQSWTTVSANIDLSAGEQTLRLNFEGSTGFLFNFNWIEFTLNGGGYPNLVFIQNKITGHKIRPLTTEGGVIVQAPADWTGNWVIWEIAPTSGDYFRLKNLANNTYLSMPTTADTDLVYATSSTSTKEEWKTVDMGDGYFLLENRASGKRIRSRTTDNIDANPSGDYYVEVSRLAWEGDWVRWKFDDASAFKSAIDTDQQDNSLPTAEQGFNLFPNPATGGISLQLSNVDVANVVIYDLAGIVVLQKQVTDKTSYFDVSGFAKGTYIVKVGNGGEVDYQKLIVQ